MQVRKAKYGDKEAFCNLIRINNIILNLDKKKRSFISFDENKIKDIYEIKNKIIEWILNP